MIQRVASVVVIVAVVAFGLGYLLGSNSGPKTAAATQPAATQSADDTGAPVDTSGASFAAIDPCALITQKQAEDLVGAKLNAPESMGASDMPSCLWSSPATNPGIHQVEIDTGDGAKSALDIDRDTLKHTFTPVTGIGDEATYEDGAIFFRKGDEWVKLSLVTLDTIANLQQKMEDLAKVIVTELP